MNNIFEANILINLNNLCNISKLIQCSKLTNKNLIIIINKEIEIYELKKQYKNNLKLCTDKIIYDYWKCFYNLIHEKILDYIRAISAKYIKKLTKKLIFGIIKFKLNKVKNIHDSPYKISYINGESIYIFNRKTYKQIGYIIEIGNERIHAIIN